MTVHAIERIKDRMMELGLQDHQINQISCNVANIALKSRVESEAVRLFTIKKMHGVIWSDKSNGNEIWAIIRGGRVVTVMFRRNTQPKTCDALRVKKVWAFK